MKINLSEKIALVIGGSRGIGAGITELLSKAGALTIFTHTGKSQYRSRLTALLARLKKEGCHVRAVTADALDSERTNAVVAEIIRKHGKIDILVVNVGQNLARPAECVTDKEWRRSIDLNLSAAFYAVRAVLPHMVERKYGRIILIGSSAAYNGGGGAIDYAAAKSGLNGMMLYLTQNYARKGIITNVVHPCVIETDLLRERYSDKEKRKNLIAQIPAGRLGKPEDIAALVTYLASAWGDYICGQSILVDGGRTLWR